MSIQDILEKMKTIQSVILQYLDHEDDSQEKYQAVLDILNKEKIQENKHLMIALFHLITKIANNHCHGPFFYERIDSLIIIFKDQIKNQFSNTEIFSIFKSNKRILLLLIEEKIMIIDKSIIDKFLTEKYLMADYHNYFQPEIESFIKNNAEEGDNKKISFDFKNEKLPDDFYEKRKIGENDHNICKLIRNDSFDEFIVYINQNNYPISSLINPSIYETNSFLLKTEIKEINSSSLWKRSIKKRLQKYDLELIDYAIFFGAIQILKYLLLNGVNLTKLSWLCAIHSGNAEIIELIEEKKDEIEEDEIKKDKDEIEEDEEGGDDDKKGEGEVKDKKFKNKFYEAIKCHQNDIANYFLNNYLQNEENSENTFVQSLKYYNFEFIQNQHITGSSFNNLCKYDYCLFVEILLKNGSYHYEQKQIRISI